MENLKVFCYILNMGESDKQWIFYLIQNGNATYAGVSPDPVRRLRQHNSEISGGAKYTTSQSSNWSHMCLVRGFQTKQQSMQFEWAVKHEAPRNKGGPIARTQKLYSVLRKPRWTSKAPDAHEVPLTIEWMIPLPTKDLPQLPLYVKQLEKGTNNELPMEDVSQSLVVEPSQDEKCSP